ncbi:unnamed protein product [Caenorhabditis auriculariae]|uniref:GTF3C1 extended winged-helix domain-containing protein n=1 Tax=Caenorhabditis auriculariae TaxID=2777116 RepID=A0A8S1H4T6_9PELO|nr:unnamed protein product [Caenorhabditis auriculariae]
MPRARSKRKIAEDPETTAGRSGVADVNNDDLQVSSDEDAILVGTSFGTNQDSVTEVPKKKKRTRKRSLSPSLKKTRQRKSLPVSIFIRVQRRPIPDSNPLIGTLNICTDYRRILCCTRFEEMETKESAGLRSPKFSAWTPQQNPEIVEFPRSSKQFVPNIRRSLRYYWKDDNQPGRFDELYEKFSAESGGPCPFKMGEVVKFPAHKLSTLRISDVTLKRLILLLELANRYRVIVTINQLMKMVESKEKAEGYKFTIDKKSLMKCMLALEKENLLHIYEQNVRTDCIDYKVQIMVFPHGQLRFSKTKKEELAKLKTKREEELANINEGSADVSQDSRLDETLPESYSDGIGLGSLGETEMIDADKRRSTTHYDASYTFGYQAKAIRCMVLHEFVWKVVRSDFDASLPDLYQRFPPGKPFSDWPSPNLQDLPVYTTEEENSPFRFVPSLSTFSDIERGWFMLQDIVVAMPLSILVLIAYVSRKIQKPRLHYYLSDPIRRHTCLGDLAPDLRELLLKDKKLYKQVEHLLLSMGVMGLFSYTESPDPKRFNSACTAVFHINAKGLLYDTSTSDRGYSEVTPPINRYKRYEHEFKTQENVVLYWHHLRAIVQSTPLAFRMDGQKDTQTTQRYRRYAMGQFDKTMILKPTDQPIDLVPPLEPNNGCAGFDCGLFFHLKRHWDLNPRPSPCVTWFISRFRKSSDVLKNEVESKVERLQKDWNSYVKSMMPADMELTRNKKMAVRTSDDTALFAGSRSAAAKTLRTTNLGEVTPKSKPSKKRKFDSVDVLSHRNRIYMRSRFSAKERDQLIIIRAIGFFLNPVYRFWLEPTVLRDIMHEYVPESRTKTVQSLMAAGVREMTRSHRLAYLRRVVRNLATFKEMRTFRSELASIQLHTAEEKSEFFRKVYEVAVKLLFLDNDVLPHVLTSDKDFSNYLSRCNVFITPEPTTTAALPLRCRKPENFSHIHHCVTVNILLSVLLHFYDSGFSENLLEQVSATVVHNALQVLRADGLVSRVRSTDPTSSIMAKNQAVLSHYFRSFFTHRYKPDLIDELSEMLEELEEAGDVAELLGDNASLVVIASSAFYNNKERDLKVRVDDDILNAFGVFHEPNSIKQIRYLESTNIHLEKVRVFFPKQAKGKKFDSRFNLEEKDPPLPTVEELLKLIDNSRSLSDVPLPFEDWLQTRDPAERRLLKIFYDNILLTEAFGVCVADIRELAWARFVDIDRFLKILGEGGQIVEVGVDTRRWVSTTFSGAWCVTIENRRYCPRPWVKPTGGLCAATIRWMAEAVLMFVVARPGCPVREIMNSKEFALQHIVLEELITVLEAAKCLKVEENSYKSGRLSSPFEAASKNVTVRMLCPSVDAIERFSNIFKGVQLLPTMHGSMRLGNSDY